jgi:transposase
MRKIKEVLRLRFELGLGQRQISRSCGIGLGTVHEYLERAAAASIGWPLRDGLSDEELEARLFENQPVQVRTVRQRPQPDWKAIHEQLQRHRHLTLQLLWEEYRQAHPEGYRYSWFCDRYQHWRRHLDVVLRQEHKAGEKMFVDWAGATIPVYDSTTGQAWPASLFVSVLGASSYTFAEATRDQQLEACLLAHIHALEFYGGVPKLIVPDNTKTAVSRACRYDPDLNPTYQEFAMHYGMGVVPARPYKPRDKAKVESGVQIVERWIVAALRNRKFFSLQELNQAIRGLLVRLNERPFRKRDGSRAILFRGLEKAALAPLPAERFDMSQWSRATVDIDYHIPFDGNLYSVPYALVQQVVEVRSTSTTLEIFRKGNRIASHRRSREHGETITQSEHRPKSHQDHLEWPPSRMVSWAHSVGPRTAQLFERMLSEKPHPEMGYRSCLGIIRLAQQYPTQRLEAAAERALLAQACRYESVKSTLKNSLDALPISPPESGPPPLTHDNIRGAGYFDREEPTSC